MRTFESRESRQRGRKRKRMAERKKNYLKGNHINTHFITGWRATIDGTEGRIERRGEESSLVRSLKEDGKEMWQRQRARRAKDEKLEWKGDGEREKRTRRNPGIFILVESLSTAVHFISFAQLHFPAISTSSSSISELERRRRRRARGERVSGEAFDERTAR